MNNNLEQLKDPGIWKIDFDPIKLDIITLNGK